MASSCGHSNAPAGVGYEETKRELYCPYVLANGN